MEPILVRGLLQRLSQHAPYLKAFWSAVGIWDSWRNGISSVANLFFLQVLSLEKAPRPWQSKPADRKLKTPRLRRRPRLSARGLLQVGLGLVGSDVDWHCRIRCRMDGSVSCMSACSYSFQKTFSAKACTLRRCDFLAERASACSRLACTSIHSWLPCVGFLVGQWPSMDTNSTTTRWQSARVNHLFPCVRRSQSPLKRARTRRFQSGPLGKISPVANTFCGLKFGKTQVATFRAFFCLFLKRRAAGPLPRDWRILSHPKSHAS